MCEAGYSGTACEEGSAADAPTLRAAAVGATAALVLSPEAEHTPLMFATSTSADAATLQLLAEETAKVGPVAGRRNADGRANADVYAK